MCVNFIGYLGGDLMPSDNRSIYLQEKEQRELSLNPELEGESIVDTYRKKIETIEAELKKLRDHR